MNEDAVSKYIDSARATIELEPQMDEANTKAAILRDFLDLLNWTIPNDTQLEYSVKAFGKTYKVDYALILDGAPVAFLEAKGVDTALSETHREQLAAYLKNEDVNLGILTNGKEYEFYRRKVVDSKVNVNTLGTAKLNSLQDRVTTLSAFTKDAIQTNESIKILNRIRELRGAREMLKNNKDMLAKQVSELFVENVSETIESQSESQAKEMIDRLVEDIESEIDGDDARPEPSRQESPSGSGQTTQPGDRGSYGVQFVEDGNVLAEFGGEQQVDVLVDAIDHLLNAYDLDSQLKPFPYIPGRTRPIIHTQTDHNGKQMKQPRKLTGGYYLETNLSADQKRREIKRLVGDTALEVRFIGAWSS